MSSSMPTYAEAHAMHNYAMAQQQTAMMPNASGKTTETKARLGKDEVEVLEREFMKNPKPTTQTKRTFADSMNVELARINVCSRFCPFHTSTANTRIELVPESTCKEEDRKEGGTSKGRGTRSRSQLLWTIISGLLPREWIPFATCCHLPDHERSPSSYRTMQSTICEPFQRQHGIVRSYTRCCSSWSEWPSTTTTRDVWHDGTQRWRELSGSPT